MSKNMTVSKASTWSLNSPDPNLIKHSWDAIKLWTEQRGDPPPPHENQTILCQFLKKLEMFWWHERVHTNTGISFVGQIVHADGQWLNVLNMLQKWMRASNRYCFSLEFGHH